MLMTDLISLLRETGWFASVNLMHTCFCTVIYGSIFSLSYVMHVICAKFFLFSLSKKKDNTGLPEKIRELSFHTSLNCLTIPCIESCLNATLTPLRVLSPCISINKLCLTQAEIVVFLWARLLSTWVTALVPEERAHWIITMSQDIIGQPTI